jgi:hypothetical protein
VENPVDTDQHAVSVNGESNDKQINEEAVPRIGKAAMLDRGGGNQDKAQIRLFRREV